MNKIISYKPNLHEVLQRLRLLYNRDSQDKIFAAMEVPNEELEKFQKEHSESFYHYPDPHQRIEFWDAVLQERVNVNDDAIPSAYLSEFDQGLYGGLLGGNVRFLSLIKEKYLIQSFLSIDPYLLMYFCLSSISLYQENSS